MLKEQNKNTDTMWRNHRQILFENTVNVTQKKIDIKYKCIMQSPYNKTGREKKLLSHF
jgi:hypothetical protein